MNFDDFRDAAPWDWPENAGEVIAEAVRDRRRELKDRIAAASMAGDLVVMNDEMADLLVSLVRAADEPDELRGAAAIALGPALEQTEIEGFDDDGTSEPPVTEPTFRSIQQALGEVHSDPNQPKEVRRRALEASVRAPEDWHKQAIHAASLQDDRDWKLTAIFCMRFVPGFKDTIRAMLESPDEEIHCEAVRAAGAHQVKAAWPHVKRLLTSRSTAKALLIAAIEAAASIRPEQASEVLDPFLDSDDEEIHDAAEDALAMARIGDAGDEDL
jgi:hypothetical protein